MCSVTWVVPRTISYQRSSAAITLDLCSLTPCTATSTILHPANSAWGPASPQQHVYATDLHPLDTSTHFSTVFIWSCAISDDTPWVCSWPSHRYEWHTPDDQRPYRRTSSRSPELWYIAVASPILKLCDPTSLASSPFNATAASPSSLTM